MLKNKERRDTLLLVVMGAITLAFLLYVFIPRGNNDNHKNGTDKTTQTKGQKSGKILPPDSSKKKELEQLNDQFKSELKTLYHSISRTNDPFKDYSTTALETLRSQLENPLVDKLFKFSFADLKDMTQLEFPENYSNDLKFNLFLSVFLVKINEEGINKKFSQIPMDQMETTIDVTAYQLLGNELESDYQLLPVLFYFKHLVARLNFYPWVDSTAFFKEKLKEIRDLSPGKLLEKMRDLLHFSNRKERYRIEWREHDGIGPDDKKSYGNLNMDTFNFMEQEYLLFPDEFNLANNTWLRELHDADSGDIELIKLSIQKETPSTYSQLRNIIYTPVNSQFVAVFKEYEPGITQDFLARMVAAGMAEFHKSYTIIGFNGLMEDKSFKKALKTFGNYLKKNNQSTNDG